MTVAILMSLLKMNVTVSLPTLHIWIRDVEKNLKAEVSFVELFSVKFLDRKRFLIPFSP